MSLSAATTLAQVFPALLVVGLLGPLLAGWKVEWPERGYFASQTLLVISVEGLLLYFVIHDQPVPAGVAVFAQLAILYSLIGIAVFALAWAKKTPDERAELRAAKQRKVEAKGSRSTED